MAKKARKEQAKNDGSSADSEAVSEPADQSNRRDSALESPGAERVLSPDATANQIKTLTAEIIGQAEALRRSVHESELQSSLQELRNAATVFRSMTENATTRIATDASQNVNSNALHYSRSDIRSPAQQSGCGCHGCGDECVPKCCIELYMSGISVLEGQVLEGRMELVAAVQAGQTWGLTPGLTSFLSILPGRGLKLNDPIARFCVPCGECLTVPLHAEVMERSDGSWLGSKLEGRVEVGSAQGAMTLRCDCSVAAVKIPVALSPNQRTTGAVAVEISARRIMGGCC